MNFNRFSKLKIIIFLILFFGIFGWAAPVGAANMGGAACNSCADTNWSSCTAADAAQATIQTCVNNAADGATINIPADTKVWTDSVGISHKSLTIKGTGTAPCALDVKGRPTSCPVNIILSNANLFVLYDGAGATVRIEDLSVSGTVPASSFMIGIQKNYAYVILGRIKSRITAAGGTQSKAVWVGYDINSVYGMAEGSYKQKVLLYAWDFLGTAFNDEIVFTWGRYAAWTEGDDFGTDNAVFVENSSIGHISSGAGFGFCTDSDVGGARFVIRHNDIFNCGLGTHDPNNGFRGHMLSELYNNNFTCPGGDCSSTCMLGNRGGTGVYYNNTGTGNWAAWSNEIARVSVGPATLGSWCGGGGKICSSSTYGLTMHCSGAPHEDCNPYGAACTSGTCTKNCTSDSQCASGQICASIDGADAYGWPCRDQAGRGTDDPVTHQPTLAPVYAWNNTLNRSVYNASGAGVGLANYVQENRDFCNHSPATDCGAKSAWIYIPYAYPHPLTLTGSDTIPPAAPAGVKVN